MIAGRGRFQADAGMLLVTVQKRLKAAHSTSRSKNVEGPTTDHRQCERWHHQATGAGRA